MAAALVGGAVLSSILNVVFDRLSSPEVVNWVQGKKLNQKLLGRLKTTLYAVQALLNDAEKRQIKERAVKDWLDSLKDAVYKADDLLDEVSTKAATQKDAGNFLSRFLNLQDREMVNRMEDITDTIESIVRQKDILGLKEIPKEDLSWRVTTSLVEISDVYGRDKDKDAIIKLLLDNTSDGKISVIPIVGMGGIGKTTLAQLVYHDDKVKQNFDFQSWVCVSEEFDVIKVTRTIIEAITSSSCNMKDLNLLQHDLKERLSRQKFLIVLDDAWNENYDDWNRLLKPFQNGVKGCRILVTTRSKTVASLVQTVPPHELSRLSHEDCWLVFAKHALLFIEPTKNPTLEKTGRDIVTKCNGLPLAAQTLGGLLRGNRDVNYWNQILKSEIWEFSEDRSKIIPALRISYYCLPSCLKECFVYCSLYPKDYEFNKHELILLWMAENFLQPVGEKTLEEVGYEYFDELVSRSLFQPHSTLNNVLVMHDLVHDLAMFYAGEFYFRAEEFENAVEIDIKNRHLSHNAKGNYPMSELLTFCDRVKHTRTFLEINLEPRTPFGLESAPCVLLFRLKCLRVLSFELFPLDSLPDLIGELIHLRYLDLSDSHIVTLPESIGNLYNLQTLKLVGCRKLKMLPISMQNVVNLRHLDIIGCSNLREMPNGIRKLINLQFLSEYIVGKHEKNKIGELGALTNLHRSLNISKLENVINCGEALEARMVDKKHLNSLTLAWSRNCSTADSQIERGILDKLRPHVDLKELTISGYSGTMFPNWLGHSSHHNISELSLWGCRNCCMLPSLGQLPSLKYLSISDFDGLEIIGAEFYKNDESCLETPFPSLETLSFYSMPCWKEWHSSEFDAFPRLKVLRVSNCPVLTGDLPNQLASLETLYIDRCEQLNSSLPGAPAIHELAIRGNNKVRMGDALPSVNSLTIEGCHLVEPVLEAITQRQLTCLRYLDIRNCSSAISFPGACLPASLQDLSIRNCKKLEFQVQQQHESLQSLGIFGSCDSLTSFSLDAFPNLGQLYIGRCENMKSLEVSQSLSSLRSIEIHGCENMKSLEVSQSLSSLRSIGISSCPNFLSFTTLGMFAPQLEFLTIQRCPEIDPFPKGDPQPKLRYLHISHSEKLMSFLSSMDSQIHFLTHLTIDGDQCEDVKSFPKDGLLPASLKSLHLCRFPSLETLDCKGLIHLTSLESLHLWQFPSLETLDCKGLIHLTSLESLHLCQFSSLETLDCNHLTSLQELSIEECPKLENVAGERLPASLIRLSVSSSPLLGKRCEMKDLQVWPKISHIRSILVDGEWIW